MTLGIFATWILVGLLAGGLAGMVVAQGGSGRRWDITLGLLGSVGLSWMLRAMGIVSGSSLVLAAVIALVGAALAIVAQRKLRPTDGAGERKPAVWQWGLAAAAVVTVLWLTLGPTQQPAATAAMVEDRTYAVTPASMKVKAGIVAGEIDNLKVVERVDTGSAQVVSAARLTGMLRLTNTSTNQTVRLVGAKLHYLDTAGRPIEMEMPRSAPSFKFTASGSERLDPGQDAIEALDVDFPTEALKAKNLKEMRLELVYIPSPYREETVRIPVSIGAGK
ncbi:MAG: GlsB/YeaQ/YmgE family stress response membrane protein [Candidatus Rokubacteria bacterium]|nr:GlsB/YeaQ/YmgE family stress response membrane protein [Candidatus Rokubacteria bacterium]